jgi:hypothetical protein
MTILFYSIFGHYELLGAEENLVICNDIGHLFYSVVENNIPVYQQIRSRWAVGIQNRLKQIEYHIVKIHLQISAINRSRDDMFSLQTVVRKVETGRF